MENIFLLGSVRASPQWKKKVIWNLLLKFKQNEDVLEKFPYLDMTKIYQGYTTLIIYSKTVLRWFFSF